MQQNKKLNSYATCLVFLLVLLTSVLSYLALNQIEKFNRVGIQQVLQTFLLTAQEAQNILIEQQRITALSIASSKTTIELTSQLLASQSTFSHSDKLTANKIANHKTLIALEQHIDLFIAPHEKSEFVIISPDAVPLASSDRLIEKHSHILSPKFNNQLMDALAGKITFIPADQIARTNQSSTKNDNTPNNMLWLAPINHNSKTIAVLALMIDTSAHFTKITSYTHLGKSGETIAFNAKGQLLTPHRESHLNAGSLITCERFLPRTATSPMAIYGEDTCHTSDAHAEQSLISSAIWNEEYQYGLITSILTEEAMGAYSQTEATLIQVISLTTALSVLILLIIHSNRKRSEQRILLTNQQLETRVKKRTIALEQAKAELSVMNKELEVLAITDNLTGLFNKRYYDMQLVDEWHRCMRNNHPIAILIFDIDFFKQYNDYYGHQAGDECLKKVGKFLAEIDINRRPGDVIARYGGEEFVVLLTAPSLDYCRNVARKLCDGIQALNIPHERSKLAHTPVITVSVGCALATDIKSTSPDKLLNHADKALYTAKHRGRNCVHIYQEDQESILTPINSNK